MTKTVRISAEDAKKLREVVRRLVRAEVAASCGRVLWCDIPIIEADLKAARVRFGVLLAQLEGRMEVKAPNADT